MSNFQTVDFETVVVDALGQPQESQHHSIPGFILPLGGTSLELVALPAGKFLMGALKTEEGWHPSQSPLHEVTIAPFWMGIYPVTQAQWCFVAGLEKISRSLTPQPSCFKGDDYPVEQVSWLDAVEFCDRLSAQTGLQFRLPSEAEWEYACRAGTTTPFHYGETITTDLANYSGVDWELDGRVCSKGAYGKGPTGSDRRETVEVKHFPVANAFGLHGMHGNVREWCLDCWHPTYQGAPNDGSAWLTEGDCNQRVLRGGSWNSGPRACRSAARSRMEAEAGLYDVGFRVVCTEGGAIAGETDP
jgi:formylglycine-generating enzyme required for sulfatase activity